MNRSTDAPRRLLACLSDASRFRIVRVLGEAERCVTEIAVTVGLSQSCTTRHLQALGRDGLVRRRREGKRVVYGLDDRDPDVRELLDWIGASDPETPPHRDPPPRAAVKPGHSRRRPTDARRPDQPREPESQTQDSQPVRPAQPTRPGDLEDYLL